MTQLATRRGFVASLAGLPLAIAASPAFAATQQTPPDPIALELLTESIAALNDSPRHPAESARRHARVLRLMAALLEKEGADRIIGEQLRRQRSRGDNLLFEQVDIQATARELRRLGVTIPLGHLRNTAPDPERKRRALDRLEREGAVVATRKAADAFEALAPKLEVLRGVRQTKAEQRCAELNGTLDTLENLAAFNCLMAAIASWFAPLCFSYGAAYLAYKIYVESTGECS